MTRTVRLILGLTSAMAIAGVVVVTTSGGGSKAAQSPATSKSTTTSKTHHETSRNWAGYVVDSKSGHSYSAVSGTWTVPKVTSTTGWGSTADWVGIGGSSRNSKALEQTGTSSDVVNGKAKYYAWYEIVPAAETNFKLAVHPGDQMLGRVTVYGKTVTMSLLDKTTGHSVTKTQHPSKTDTSSAEWIAEAPSVQTPGGNDEVLPLDNFGKVTFANASATAGGQSGSISDPDGTTDQIRLTPGAPLSLPGHGTGAFALPALHFPSSGGATTGNLSSDGSSFSVSYTSSGTQSSSSAAIRRSSGLPGIPVGFGRRDGR